MTDSLSVGSGKTNLAQVRIDTQHVILLGLQGLLEHICHEFCKRHIPSVLQAREIECAEALGLHGWAGLICEQRNKFGLEIKRDELARLLESAQNVAKLAFHRTRIDAAGMDALLANSEALANVFKVEEYKRVIGALRAKIRGVMSTLAGRERKLRFKMERQLERLAVQKAEIIRREDDAKAALEAGSDKYQSRAKVAVMKAMQEASMVGRHVDTDGKGMESDESGVSVVFEDV